ncbi:hypothetical protein FZC83_02425 [Rossellomorea marisflavi]|uniref:Uncharacterized protein n=1 Tax=Rossellomorea marisflavi TaxID=189381 RepID=A0A5D4RZR1_9BACI|nr:hypothetical protein [Rossellomorea marisflavi]TYS56450.1 hypothetical protein FZC83_02425 [Rossellomorea marisflavi]
MFEGMGKVLITFASMIGIFALGYYLDNIVIIIAGIFPIIALGYYNYLTDNEVYDQTENKIKKVFEDNSFSPTDYVVGGTHLNAVAISEDNERILLLSRDNLKEDFRHKEITFSSVMEASLKEDGETISKASRGSQLGGALVGGAIAGGTGAIIGGLSSSRSSKDVIKSIDLKLTINDLSSPYENINIMNHHTPLKKDSTVYKECSNNAEKWLRIFSIIIKRNELNKETV